MFSGNHARCGWRPAGLIVVGLLFTAAIGCGETNPFDMAPVTGKITYEDGALIPATRIRVEFIPEGEAIGKQYPKSGRADVDPNDGAFRHVTTHKHNDGLIVGRHEVSAVSYDADNNSTQLEIVNREVEVTAGENTLEIKVTRP